MARHGHTDAKGLVSSILHCASVTKYVHIAIDWLRMTIE